MALLDGVDGIGAAGGLDVQGGLSCGDPGTVNTWETARAATFTGFTSSSLTASAWGSACPVDEAFTKWPAMFTPAAYDAANDAADNFTASDGATGQPYVLLGAPVSLATAALAPSAGGEVLGGTTAGGTSNPAAPGVQQGSAGDPVNTEDGAFTQSYTDVSLPGFGPSLDFTRSYDSTQAQKQTQAGTPGPMGYGWTDNWATSLSAAEPTPGDIYAAEGLRTGNGDGGPASSSITSGPAGVTVDGAGDVYFADTLNNRVQEVPATSGTQWGVSMTAGDVYTVAGQTDGQGEEPLDGGLADGTPALQAVLHHPEGVTVDSAGDLFIADTLSCRVLEVQPDGDNGTGVIQTVAGVAGQCGYNADGIAATSAYLNQPASVKLGQSSGQTQDLYIADSLNNRIRMVPARTENPWNIAGGMQAGDIYTVVGPGNGQPTANGTAEQSADLNDPLGVTLNGGSMFIADTGNCRIAVDSQGGGTIFNVGTSADKIYTVAGRNGPGNCATGNDNKPAISSDLDAPTSVRDPNGNLYITDSLMNRVQQVNSAGTVTTASSGFSDPQDLAADGSGDIFVADTGNGIISEVPAGSGSPSLFAGGSPWKLTNTGNGGPAVNAALNNPAAVASDGHGDVFIADQSNNRIQEIAAYGHTQFGISMLAGDAYTVAGNQYGLSGGSTDGVPATSTYLWQPGGVAADSAGDLYIADTGDAAIRKVDASSGDISTVAGIVGATGPFSGNGTAATSATLDTPTAVAVDTVGDVFLADSGNNEVLEVPASGGSHYGISGMTAGDIYVIAGASSIPTAPAAPTGLTVTGTTSSSVSLSWTAPSGTVTGYQVYEEGGLSNTLVASPTTTSATITGLSPSTGYTFFVKAVNSAGSSAASSTVTATTPAASSPAAPAGLAVTGTTSSTVSLSWTAPAGTVTGYKVFENGSSTALSTGVTIIGTTATVSGLTASTTYTFTVAATNSAGTGPQSSPVSATTAASGGGGGVPAAPTGLTVTGTTSSTVSLSWTAPAGTVTGYQVFENGSSTPLSSGVSITGTTATVSGLTRATTYTFAVAAVNTAGTGPKSNSVSATTSIFLRAGGNPAVRLLATADPSGNSGDGGPATAALLTGPAGLAVDAAGNVYISDSGNNQVREIANATGTQWGQPMTASDIYTVAGSQSGAAGSVGSGDGDGGPATAAALSDPQQIALDTAGDLYITDTSSNRVREIAGASGAQWSQSMTAGDIYTAAGTTGSGSAASAFTQEDGGPALAAGLWAPYGIGTDPYGDLFVLQQGLGHVVSQLQEIAATGTPSIPAAAGQISSLYPLTTTSGGITITQPDGSQITFQAQAPGGGCPAPYVTSGQYCAQDEFPGVTLTGNGLTWTYSPSPGADTYTYSQTRSPDGTYPLIGETDPAGNPLTITYQSPAPGTGRCPAAASSCETITAASGRTLVIGSDASGRVTSVTDPMSRTWTYAYSGGQLTSATGPVTGETTSYGYGQGTSGPLLANALTTITGPNAQPGGPDAGDSTVNAYDALGRVTSQTDPMGFKTTFNYCVNAAAGDCMNPATGTGYVTVTDPDGNTSVDSYDHGVLAAETHLTAGAVIAERDYNPLTWAGIPSGGTLLNASETDGNGNTTTYTYDANGDQTSATAPGPDGPAIVTSGYTGEDQDNCDGTAGASAMVTCIQATGPAPVSPGGVISPPSSAPPLGLSYILYDTNGNELYATTGVYQPGSASASYLRTTYQLFNGNSVTLNGTSIGCAARAPSSSLPCATINADGVVTQLGYDAVET